MKTQTPWSAYVGAALALLGLAWQAAGAWFDLQHRIARLEEQQRFSHGDLSPFLPTKE